MIGRRSFLCLGIAASTLPPYSVAQAPARVYRIVLLYATPRPPGPAAAPLMAELAALGYVQGRNLEVEARWADSDPQRLPSLAAELVALRPDVIYTAGTPAARAAKEATGSIPVIIGFLSDPVASGLVSSLDRPGGNLTGVSNFSLELAGKHVELLHSILPSASRFAALMNANPNHPLMLRQAQAAAERLGLKVLPVRAGSAPELATAFEQAAHDRADGIIVLTDPISHSLRKPIAEHALKAKLPSIYAVRTHVDVGGLLSYGEKTSAALRLQALYIDKLFKGARPGDLPIQQPTDFELAVNMKTARALGIKIPQSLLLRADDVIT